MIKVNDYVDSVYVVNLDRNEERLEHMDSELKRYSIEYNRFKAVDGTIDVDINDKYKNHRKEFRNVVGLLRTHVGIMKDALEKGYEKIMVFEDDVIMCDDFNERFDYYVKNLPDDWQVAYLGCHFNACPMPRNPIDDNRHIFPVKMCFGTFSMMFNNKNNAFEKIIKEVKKERMALDDYYAIVLLRMLRGFVFLPLFVKTAPFKSMISSHDGTYKVVDRHFEKRIFGQ